MAASPSRKTSAASRIVSIACAFPDENSETDLLYELFRRANIFHARVAGFAFDGAIAGEVQFAKRCEKFAPRHFAGSSNDFLAPHARRLRTRGVLDVSLLEPWAQ